MHGGLPPGTIWCKVLPFSSKRATMTDDNANPQNATGLKVDYFSVPETFIDGLSGMQVRNGVVKLNFFAVRHRQDGSDQPVGVTTLAVNLADFIGLVNGLNTAMRQLQTQGAVAGAPIGETQGEA